MRKVLRAFQSLLSENADVIIPSKENGEKVEAGDARQIIGEIPKAYMQSVAIPLLISPGVKNVKSVRFQYTSKTRKTHYSIGVSSMCREEAVSVLFEDFDTRGDGMSVPEAVSRSLLGCTPSVRAAVCAGGVVVIGGGSDILGLRELIVKRAQTHLTGVLAKVGPRMHLSRHSDRKTQYMSRLPAMIRAWVGGSLAAAAGVYDKLKISEEGRRRDRAAEVRRGSFIRPPLITRSVSAWELPDWTNLLGRTASTLPRKSTLVVVYDDSGLME
ncbi:hypothetical protein AAMO2058_000031300 [Amorphochlora amoebiformis]